jgi:DNA-binding MarR family transcriptional regulator
MTTSSIPDSLVVDTARAPARGQQIVMLLAASGQRLAVHIGEVLEHADLATNVPVLILCDLALRGALRPRDLLEPTHLTSGALSKQLDHLEGLGLVERTFGTVRGDRRGSIVSLTAEGRRAAEAIGQAVEDRIDDMRSLSDELIRLLGDQT